MSYRDLTPTGFVALAADPAGPNAVGDTYFNTTSNVLRSCSVAGSPGTFVNSGGAGGVAAAPTFASLYKLESGD